MIGPNFVDKIFISSLMLPYFVISSKRAIKKGIMVMLMKTMMPMMMMMKMMKISSLIPLYFVISWLRAIKKGARGAASGQASKASRQQYSFISYFLGNNISIDSSWQQY